MPCKRSGWRGESRRHRTAYVKGRVNAIYRRNDKCPRCKGIISKDNGICYNCGFNARWKA